MNHQNMHNYAARLHVVRQQFTTWQIDALLITGSTNRRWLSGFTGSNGRLLITPTKAILATDSRYYDQMTYEAPEFELFKDQRRPEDTVALLDYARAKRIGLEANHITLADARLLQKQADITWVELSASLEQFRSIKTESEIEIIQTAANITDQTMAQVRKIARPGITEAMLAWELEKHMRENGANATAFDIIVAFGANSALPHHHPGNKRLNVDDIVLVDIGADVDGYKSDLTRTFYLGSPSDEFLFRYNLVKSAKTAVLEKCRPGMDSKAVDAIARNVIKAAGCGDQFGHSLGHNLGLDIHEDPYLSNIRPPTLLHANMVITIEPGVYFTGWGGIRLEDLALLTPNGFKLLSHAPHTPHI